TRSFTYVDDVADAIVTIGLHPHAEGEDFNIGTGTETSIRELLGLLWSACGEEGSPSVRYTDPLPVDVRRRVPDVTKISERLGWTSRITLEEGVRRTVDWYLDRSDPVQGSAHPAPATRSRGT